MRTSSIFKDCSLRHFTFLLCKPHVGVKPADEQRALAPSYLHYIRWRTLVLWSLHGEPRSSDKTRHVSFLSAGPKCACWCCLASEPCCSFSCVFWKDILWVSYRAETRLEKAEHWNTDACFTCKHSSITSWCRRHRVVADRSTVLGDFYFLRNFLSVCRFHVLSSNFPLFNGHAQFRTAPSGALCGGAPAPCWTLHQRAEQCYHSGGFFSTPPVFFLMALEEINLRQCHCLSVPTELVC